MSEPTPPPRRHHHRHHHSRSKKKKKSKEPSLDALPQAVKERIAAFLRPAELCALGQTSRGWRALCGGDALWRTLYAAEFHVAGALPERPAPPNDRWRDAFARQRALFAHIDACRRAARPRQGWTEHEALLREAVALRHDDVLTHVFATIGRKGGDAALLRAVTRALAVASAAPVAAPTMVARIAALFPNSPGFRDEQGNTALHCASTREIALLLQKAGASAAAVNDAGAYPIHTAAAAGNAEVVRCLLDSESIALRTATGDTPLTIACFNGALPVVRLLANVGADLRAANANGMLPLHCAAVGNHIEVVRFLLSKGCNPAAVDDHGNTPMDLCAARGHLDLIEVFLGALKKLITVEQISSLTLTRLGSGAFGDVFKASLGGRQVALKRVRTKSLMDAGKTAEWIRQKFLLEVALANKLSANPNFVSLVAACVTQPNDYWMVLEFVAGGSIFELVHGVTRWANPPSVNGIARGIADGMAHLHAQVPQIIHRDLTSANVLLDSEGNIKIADFGISRFKLDLGECTMTYIGNPRWRAPEVTRGEHYASAVDVYAFGVIVWELVSGNVPFQDLDGALACLEAAKGKRPEIPHSCPQPWADLIRKCWDHDPSRRPSFEAIRSQLATMPPLRVFIGKPAFEAAASLESY